MEALQDLGHLVVGIDTISPEIQRRATMPMERLRRKFWGPRDLGQINEQVIQMVETHSPDILWIDKGLIIDPDTLLRVKKILPRIVRLSYSPDDMLNPDNQSNQYLHGIPLYELHITTKSYNVRELQDLGARAVFRVNNAYCPKTHRPMSLTPEEQSRLGGAVGFIGSYEQPRAELVSWLARQGITVKVWGNWPKKLGRNRENLIFMGQLLKGEEYAKGLCAFDINLAFLCKRNRDRQTTRTMEIPACGSFMLAERTDEHLALFQEGKEAEFFATPGELLDKIRYYLDHEDERRSIAAAGLYRCRQSGYSNPETLVRVLAHLSEHRYFLR
jgi:hypothetical protein